MSLINCPTCQKEISPNAASCPHCGEPLKRPAEAGNPGAINLKDPVHFIGILVCVIIIVGVFVAYANA